MDYDYKQLIIDMLDKIKSQEYLERVYKLMVYLYLKEDESGD